MTLQLINSGPYKDRKMHEKTKQMIWRMLLKTGYSNHSALHITLPYLFNRLEQEGRAYELKAHPGIGYHLKLIPHARDMR